MRALAVAALAALLGAVPAAATADPPLRCEFLQAPALPFGIYDPLARADTTTISDVTFNCKGKDFSVQVAIDGGRTGNVLNRGLTGPSGDVLRYQIYQDVSRSEIWGNGASAPPVTVYIAKNNTDVLLHAFAVIPAGQDVTVGAYGDSLLLTLMY